MIIQSVTRNGAQIAPNDDEKFSRWVWADQVHNAIKWIRNDANVAGNAQLCTGITVYEDEAVDLLNRIQRAAALATQRSITGRAS